MASQPTQAELVEQLTKAVEAFDAAGDWSLNHVKRDARRIVNTTAKAPTDLNVLATAARELDDLAHEAQLALMVDVQVGVMLIEHSAIGDSPREELIKDKAEELAYAMEAETKNDHV